MYNSARLHVVCRHLTVAESSSCPLPDSADVHADETLLSGPLHKVQQGTQQPARIQQAIELNQARALMCKASGDEAVSMYRKLEDTGMLTFDKPDCS